MDILVCETCQRDDLDARMQTDHLTQMLEHEGLLRAMHVIHGQFALQRFFEVGGVLHLKIEDVQRWLRRGAVAPLHVTVERDEG